MLNRTGISDHQADGLNSLMLHSGARWCCNSLRREVGVRWTKIKRRFRQAIISHYCFVVNDLRLFSFRFFTDNYRFTSKCNNRWVLQCEHSRRKVKVADMKQHKKQKQKSLKLPEEQL